jgi:hypothetical protein
MLCGGDGDEKTPPVNNLKDQNEHKTSRGFSFLLSNAQRKRFLIVTGGVARSVDVVRRAL